MKHVKFLFLIIGLTILASCSKSDEEGGPTSDANQATFSGVIGKLQTRVTGDSWNTGDAIGIYALKADQALSAAAIFDGKSNVKFTTTGNGTFTPSATQINFPESGNLDFVAYYPFQNMAIDFVYNIDVSTQFSPAAIDLLYSNNAKGKNKTQPNVDLKFKHMLSKLVFHVTLGENMSLSNGFNVSIKDIVVDGLFDLINGKVAVGQTRKKVSPVVNIASDNKSATATAIVVPGQNLKDVTIEFTLDGKKYEWTPYSQELVPSTKYSYALKLVVDDSGLPTVVPLKVGATIEEWQEGNTGGGEVVLIPTGDSETPEPGVFVVDKSEITLEANTGLNNTIKLTAENTQQWAAASNATWLRVTPASGTGNTSIVTTAEENTSETQRSAKVTITSTGDDSVSPIIITVTQKGKTISSGEPDGSKNNPYTFAEARDKQGAKDNTDYVWVKGFIVGTSNSGGDFVPIFSTDNASGTNILIADNKDETNGSNLAAVQLAFGGVARTDLNLVNNPGVYKAEVKLYGTLEPYFGTTGLKNVKEYELITTGKGR